MLVWLERFVLTLCAAAFLTIVVLNALNFDWAQRITLAVAIVAISYVAAHTIQKQRSVQATQQSPTIPKPSLPLATEKTIQTPSQNVPRVLFLYQEKQFRLYNLEDENLYLWGVTYGEGSIAIEKEPRVIPPKPAYYYLFADTFERRAREALEHQPEILVPCHFFLKTERSNKYTVKCALFAKRSDTGDISFNPQTISITKGWVN